MGAAFLSRGIAVVARSPGLWAIGLVPAVLTLVLVGAGLVGLALQVPRIAEWLTPFAAGWDPGARDTLRALVDLLLIGAGAGLAIVGYTAVTLAVGQPFYEAIARRVDERAGPVPWAADPPWWRSVGRAARDGALLVTLTASSGAVLLLIGLVPVVGETLVPVVGACVTGFFLSVELTAIALERRGLRLGDRLRLLWRRRLLAIGFGVAVFLLFLVPLGAVLGMPAAVCGGTLLARRLTGGQRSAAEGTVAGRAPVDGRG